MDDNHVRLIFIIEKKIYRRWKNQFYLTKFIVYNKKISVSTNNNSLENSIERDSNILT